MNQSFAYYVHRHAEGKLTPDERAVLIELLRQPQYQDELKHLLDADWQFWETLDVALPERYAAIKEHVLQEIQRPSAELARIPLLRRWGRAAAIIILVLGAAAAFIWYANDTDKNQEKPLFSETNDIPPGTNKAVLIVDEEQFQLASDKTGITVREKIAYTDGEQLAEAGQLLKLTTPNGGQYQLELPDGSKVWLNAASSIEFPSKFTGNQRHVKITGEAYLEVAHNKAKPFIVDVDGKATVEVLGTSFNINSYENEAGIKTTLVTGSVKINQQVVLKPGQQAVQPGNGADKISVTQGDIEKALAWKNGWFNFNGASLYDVMRQLERWYDIKVQYEGDIPEVKFKGKMDKGVSLSGMLNLVTSLDVQIKMTLEGRTLIISGS